MPVLSEQMTVVDPSVSTEASRFMIALRLASRPTPIARVTVTTAGRPSGMAATASATELISASLTASPSMRGACTSATTNTAATATRAINASRLPSAWICSCNGVGFSSAAPSRPARRPTSVDMPVSVTTNSARPRTSVVFMNPTLTRSARATSPVAASASSCLSTGTDSPVSIDSSTEVAAVSTNRPSAGTRSPASNSTTSPGTRSAVGTSCTSPPRRTRTMDSSMPLSAASALSARFSWTKPMIALMSSTIPMTIGSFRSPTASDTTAAPIRM